MQWTSQLPNALSCTRIILSPIFLILFSVSDYDLFLFSLLILIIALVTDLIDGWLARRLLVSTEIGYILDGIGDKAIYIALFLSFQKTNLIDIIFTWLLIFREIAIYGLRSITEDLGCVLVKLRFFSLFYAFFVRVWMLFILFKIYISLTVLNNPMPEIYDQVTFTLLLLALIGGYMSLFQYIRATVDHALKVYKNIGDRHVDF